MDLIPRRFFMNDIFDDFMPSQRDNHHMRCDIYEKDGLYNIEMDIPGFDKKEEAEDNSDKNYIRRERLYGKYQRSFYIGDLDSENVKANFKDGMLRITVPKKTLSENKKVIEIED